MVLFSPCVRVLTRVVDVEIGHLSAPIPRRPVLLFIYLFIKNYLTLERGEEREKERDRNIDVRETH